MSTSPDAPPPTNPLREIIDPFVHLVRAPRALWGVNASYFLEGLCYFGILTLMTLYFSSVAGLDDVHAGWVVGGFTGGITLAMFFLGDLADRWGVRIALAASLVLMVVGRAFLAGGSLFGGHGLWSPVFLVSAGGLLLVVIGYGMYMPASYTAVRQFTTKKTSGMGYAMLYALMNLGAFLSGIISPRVRGNFGIEGIYWVYTAMTVAGVILVLVLLSRRTVDQAIARAAAEDGVAPVPAKAARVPFNLRRWLREHPLGDLRFSFFIFVLIPVQTLFAHQWLTLPAYVLRAYEPWVARNMEFFVNLNPLLIFVLTPIIAAATEKSDVYKMMIRGTVVMALPTFLLAFGPNVATLGIYILLMSIGEAMWQPRFLQLAAELAPEGKTGQYMGIAQFPWFLTKVLTSLYSGAMLQSYCPETGARNTEMLWLIYGAIAMASPIMLWLARKWMADKLSSTPGGATA
jgi:proton-dependent oligopeptide transporter, POT family